MAAGVDYYGPVNTSHNMFCLETLKHLMKDWLVESYLVMKSAPRVPSVIPLLSIGYKYNSRNVLTFIDTEGGGSTAPDDPYLSRFPDIYSNVSVCPVIFPHLIGRYFNDCNAIYNHNMM